MSDIIPISETELPPSAKEASQKKQNSIKRKQLLMDLNKRFAVVFIGGLIRIADLSKDTPRYLSVNDFKTLLDNVFVEPDDDDEAEGAKRKKAATAWLSWKHRRLYDSIDFAPNLATDDNVFNLWKGWRWDDEEITPNGKFDLFLDHVKTNICSQNEDLYEWVLDWLADLFQHPDKKNGVALVLRSSAEGTGKGRFATTIANMLQESNYLHILQAGQLVGRFNAHLEYKVLAFVDEAFWGGDQQSKGALYGMITEPYITLEDKHKSAVCKRNYLHFIMATNLTWAVPANASARRFCVLDVAENAIRNRPYFTAIEDQLRKGNDSGYKALLHFLLNRKYDRNIFSEVPKTEALLDQKLHGISDELKWWYEVLVTGKIGDTSPWNDKPLGPSIDCDVFYNAYLKWTEQLKIRHPKTKMWLPRNINDYGGLTKQGTQLKRMYAGTSNNTFYNLDTIAVYRAAFEERLCQKIEWGDE